MGLFAMTERGHGSHARGIQTEATLDLSAQMRTVAGGARSGQQDAAQSLLPCSPCAAPPSVCVLRGEARRLTHQRVRASGEVDVCCPLTRRQHLLCAGTAVGTFRALIASMPVTAPREQHRGHFRVPPRGSR